MEEGRAGQADDQSWRQADRVDEVLIGISEEGEGTEQEEQGRNIPWVIQAPVRISMRAVQRTRLSSRTHPLPSPGVEHHVDPRVHLASIH